MSWLPSREDLLTGARLLWTLPASLRRPVTTEDARAIVRQRLERREPDFLTVARRAIYEHEKSPYRSLLARAGCEYGDLERLVRREGVEGALGLLFRAGVYLTVDEFKGRRPIVRGGATLAVDPARLVNPDSRSSLRGQSSGSRGASTTVPIDMRFIRDAAVQVQLGLDARRASGCRIAYWDVPGGTLRPLLTHAMCRVPVTRWFSPVDPSAPGLQARYRWSAGLLRLAGGLARWPLPAPEHVPIDNPMPIVRWMSEVLQAGEVPLLHTYSSPGLRLCRAATDAGIDLGGARLTLYGEPITEARLAGIRQSGAEATPLYVATETWRIGDACLAPGVADEVHLFDDLHAVIQPGSDGPPAGLPAHALLMSTLRPTAPLVLLNVSVGDQAVVGRRPCGCPLAELGWETHLHTIRSFEKLTAGGMTFLDVDVIRVLEQTLPARFGGMATDYQLLEEETADGLPCVRLLVRPEVGPLDPATVTEVFLDAISAGDGAGRVMGLVWRQTGLLRVERRAPLTTSSGKILHLHATGSSTVSDDRR